MSQAELHHTAPLPRRGHGGLQVRGLRHRAVEQERDKPALLAHSWSPSRTCSGAYPRSTTRRRWRALSCRRINELEVLPPMARQMATRSGDHEAIHEHLEAGHPRLPGRISSTPMVGRLIDASDKSPERDNHDRAMLCSRRWRLAEKHHWRRSVRCGRRAPARRTSGSCPVSRSPTAAATARWLHEHLPDVDGPLRPAGACPGQEHSHAGQPDDVLGLSRLHVPAGENNHTSAASRGATPAIPTAARNSTTKRKTPTNGPTSPAKASRSIAEALGRFSQEKQPAARDADGSSEERTRKTTKGKKQNEN